MGRTQKVVAVGVTALTVAVIGAFLLGASADTVRVLDALNSMALFGIALVVPKHYPEQWLIALALGFSAVGDLFLIPIITLPGSLGGVVGMGCFLLAYVLLTIAFLHGRPRLREVLLVVPFVLVGAAVMWLLSGYLSAVFLVAVPVFLLVITVMAWSATTTLTRGHFIPRVGWCATLGAAILFVSDSTVAFAMFHPLFASGLPPGLEVFVRGTYIAGWTLLLLIVCDPVLRAAGADERPTRPLHSTPASGRL